MAQKGNSTSFFGTNSNGAAHSDIYGLITPAFNCLSWCHLKSIGSRSLLDLCLAKERDKSANIISLVLHWNSHLMLNTCLLEWKTCQGPNNQFSNCFHNRTKLESSLTYVCRIMIYCQRILPTLFTIRRCNLVFCIVGKLGFLAKYVHVAKLYRIPHPKVPI